MTLPEFAAERRAVAPLPLSAPAAGTRRRCPQLSIARRSASNPPAAAAAAAAVDR